MRPIAKETDDDLIMGPNIGFIAIFQEPNMPYISGQAIYDSESECMENNQDILSFVCVSKIEYYDWRRKRFDI